MATLQSDEDADHIFELFYGALKFRVCYMHMCGSRGGQGVRNPLKNHKNVGFLSKTDPDPLDNHKATKPAFNVGPLSDRQRNAI